MRNLLLGIAGIALILIAAFLYAQVSDKKNISDFGAERDLVMRDYVYVVVGFSPEMLKNGASTTWCDQHNVFTSYLQEDTRQMSITDLKNAISLFDSCHYDVTSNDYMLDSNMSTSISKLMGINSKIKNTEINKITNKISDDWRQIELLQNEKINLAAKSVDNQKLYWEAELGNDSGRDSFSQRQDTFSRLNAESLAASSRIDQIDAERRTLLTDENDQWSIFLAKTGYKESTATTTNSSN